MRSGAGCRATYYNHASQSPAALCSAAASATSNAPAKLKATSRIPVAHEAASRPRFVGGGSTPLGEPNAARGESVKKNGVLFDGKDYTFLRDPSVGCGSIMYVLEKEKE